MSDPSGGYMETGERDRECASGIEIGLLTYNDPSETYSMYSECNFNDLYQKRFAWPPGQGQAAVTTTGPYQGHPANREEGNKRVQEEGVPLTTPQASIPLMEPHVPLRPMLLGVELKQNEPSYNKDYTIQMLDILDNPSFINPWVLPPITAQPPQGLVQPIPQHGGA